MDIRIKLDRIKEIRFDCYSNSELDISLKNLNLETGYEEIVEIEQDMISYLFHSRYTLGNDRNEIELLHSDVLVEFSFQYNTVISNTDKKGKLKNKKLRLELLKIVISTVRGILFAKTKGEKINEFILPIIDPIDLIAMNKQEHAVL